MENNKSVYFITIGQIRYETICKPDDERGIIALLHFTCMCHKGRIKICFI
jgi:hypothetical protein